MSNKECIFLTAVAGAGKTLFVTNLINTWIDGGIPPDEIAAVSFTVTAAKELGERISASGVHLSTVHSLAYQVCAESNAIPPYTSKFFDQLLTTGTILVRNRKPMFRAVAIDEAQDLTLLQIEFMSAILQNTEKAAIVGDPRQSIYGFLGVKEDAMEAIMRSIPQHTRINKFLTGSKRFGISAAEYIRDVCDIDKLSGSVSRETDVGVMKAHTVLKSENPISANGIVVSMGRLMKQGETGAILSYTNAWRDAFLHHVLPGSITWTTTFGQHPVGSYAMWALRCLGPDYRILDGVNESKENYGASFFGQVFFPQIHKVMKEYTAEAAILKKSPYDMFVKKPPVAGKELHFNLNLLGESLTRVAERISGTCGFGTVPAEKIAPILVDEALEIMPDLGYWADSRDNMTDLLIENLTTGSAVWGVKGSMDITLSTIHGAKGREYDHVFIVTSDGFLWGNNENLQYVALTRARKSLWILHDDTTDNRALDHFITRIPLSKEAFS